MRIKGLWKLPEGRDWLWGKLGLTLVSFPGGSEVKASASNAGDTGSIPGSGRSPGEGNGTWSSTPAWKILWTEKPGGLQSMGSQRVGQTEQLSIHAHMST